MSKKIIRIGFDLDGVLLYNPARIVRPMISIFKKLFLKKKELRFFVPKTPAQKYLWKLFHKSSIFLSPGIREIAQLVKEKKIEAYIITARYSYMGPELIKWVKRNNLHIIFTDTVYNKKDEQPHFYKKSQIHKYGIDIFIDDNWDIVEYLNKQTKIPIYWIYNIFDRKIDYKNKYPDLRSCINAIIPLLGKH